MAKKKQSATNNEVENIIKNYSNRTCWIIGDYSYQLCVMSLIGYLLSRIQHGIVLLLDTPTTFPRSSREGWEKINDFRRSNC